MEPCWYAEKRSVFDALHTNNCWIRCLVEKNEKHMMQGEQGTSFYPPGGMVSSDGHVTGQCHMQEEAAQAELEYLRLEAAFLEQTSGKIRGGVVSAQS